MWSAVLLALLSVYIFICEYSLCVKITEKFKRRTQSAIQARQQLLSAVQIEAGLPSPVHEMPISAANVSAVANHDEPPKYSDIFPAKQESKV